MFKRFAFVPATNSGNNANGNMLGSVWYFPLVWYCILPSAVWCGEVHTFSHTLSSSVLKKHITLCEREFDI